jgi:hypothetical protein
LNSEIRDVQFSQEPAICGPGNHEKIIHAVRHKVPPRHCNITTRRRPPVLAPVKPFSNDRIPPKKSVTLRQNEFPLEIRRRACPALVRRLQIGNTTMRLLAELGAFTLDNIALGCVMPTLKSVGRLLRVEPTLPSLRSTCHNRASDVDAFRMSRGGRITSPARRRPYEA